MVRKWVIQAPGNFDTTCLPPPPTTTPYLRYKGFHPLPFRDNLGMHATYTGLFLIATVDKHVERNSPVIHEL